MSEVNSVWDTPLEAPDIPAGVSVNHPADNPAPVVVQDNGFKGLPVRGNGDSIYLLKGGRKHWFPSAEIFAKFGFKFGDEVKLDEETLAVIPEGGPLS
jgi:hypothetical protein